MNYAKDSHAQGWKQSQRTLHHRSRKPRSMGNIQHCLAVIFTGTKRAHFSLDCIKLTNLSSLINWGTEVILGFFVCQLKS